jgi:hypothetical protein
MIALLNRRCGRPLLGSGDAGWGAKTDVEKAGLLQKWQNDLARNSALRDIMTDLAKLMEKATCIGSRIPGNCP